MERVAIIPARGNSKRLPRKNILPVLSKPMLSYPVDAAFGSNLFDEIIVSTEDDEIAAVAKSAGARVIDRPTELAQDRSTVVQVCLHALGILNRDCKMPEHFCCIYPTALLIQPEDILESYRLLLEEPSADFVIGVSEYDLHPVQALTSNECYLRPMWPEYQGLQSQDYPRLVASNGTLYWARVSAFLDAKSFYGEKLKGYEIPRTRAIDIDTEEDYKTATLIAEKSFRTEGMKPHFGFGSG